MPRLTVEGCELAIATPRRKRNAKNSICIHCRQLKVGHYNYAKAGRLLCNDKADEYHQLKCDAASAYPDGCSRCRGSNRQCIVDSTFRRRGHREYTQLLEQEVQSLRELHNAAPPAQTSNTADNYVHECLSHDDMDLGNGRNDSSVSAQVLGGVNITPEVVDTLLEEYFTNYHPLFPILQEYADFVVDYNANKLLLWTVLAIASCHHKANPSLYASLVDPVRKLASDIYNPQSRSFRTMQALLLLCVFNFPFAQTINDPSPLYCSLATQIGYQLGLHRPHFRADFNEYAGSSITSTNIEKKTWYGCFIVNHGLAMRLGIPTTLAPGNAILTAVTEQAGHGIPEAFLLQLNMSLLSYQWLKLLGDDESISSGQHPAPGSLIEHFDRQCTEIRQRYTAPWSRIAEISFYALQLQVYSFSLTKSTDAPQDTNYSGDNAAEMIQAKTLSTVVRLISEASRSDGSRIYWPFFPKYHVLFAAAIGIYLASSTSAAMVRLSLLDACKDAIPIIQSWSLYSRDQLARVAEHIAIAVRRIERQSTGQGQDHRPAIISRMAANIPYRVIWSAKHGRDTASNGPSNELQSGLRPPDISSEAPTSIALQTQHPDAFDQAFVPFEEGLIFGNIDDADFTDMFLDWQSLKEGAPQWTRSNDLQQLVL